MIVLRAQQKELVRCHMSVPGKTHNAADSDYASLRIAYLGIRAWVVQFLLWLTNA